MTPTEPERIWLEEIYKRYQSHGSIDPWEIRIALRDKLPKDFLPSQVNPLFLQQNSMTLLGILAVAPESERIADTERVIVTIRDFLVRNPQERTITAAQIAKQLGFDEGYTEELFGLMSTVRPFWSSATGASSGKGYSSITVGNEGYLLEFLSFENLETSLNQLREERAHADPILDSLGRGKGRQSKENEVIAVQPNYDWYKSISNAELVPNRCPYANVHRCPRYYQSLSLLSDNQITTRIPVEKDQELLKHWENSEHWPVVSEHASSITGSDDNWTGFHNFCPEVSFDIFGFFASYLHRFSDEVERDSRHSELANDSTRVPHDWRWSWQSIKPMHYTDCPLYAILNIRRTSMVDEVTASDDDIELAILKNCIERHKVIETSSQPNSDKCAREVDIRVPIRQATGALGQELDYLGNLWLGRLAPSTPGVSKGVLRPCSNSELVRGPHKFNVRAFTDPINSQPAPAWDRIRALEEKFAKTIRLPRKELEQKFKILFSAAQERRDFDEWQSTSDKIGLVFLDIDHFKDLNKGYTETKVDTTVLPDFQHILRKVSDHRGAAYRHGGEEFVIILPNHDLDETRAFAERVRATIEVHNFQIDQKVITITASVGVALWPLHGSGLEEVLAAANRAEHVAKERGRNRVEIA